MNVNFYAAFQFNIWRKILIPWSRSLVRYTVVIFKKIIFLHLTSALKLCSYPLILLNITWKLATMLPPRLAATPSIAANLLSLIRRALSLSFQSASCLNWRYRTKVVKSARREQKLNSSPKTLLSGRRLAVSLIVGNHEVSLRTREIM